MPDRIEPFLIVVDEAALDDLRDRLRRSGGAVAQLRRPTPGAPKRDCERAGYEPRFFRTVSTVSRARRSASGSKDEIFGSIGSEADSSFAHSVPNSVSSSIKRAIMAWIGRYAPRRIICSGASG